MSSVTHPAKPAQAAHDLLTVELLRSFDTAGPRYTSYPTADRFGSDFGAVQTISVLQTLRFARTIEQIGQLRPDRIALYAYAHLSERFKPQRRIADGDLPDAAQRVAMLGNAIAGFLSRDYCYIGMDHFALPADPLAVAKREGRLQRNFQGYSTQPDCNLVALGVSAIGRVGNAYYQNAKTLPEYYEQLQQGRLPVVRGYALTADDALRPTSSWR